MTVLASRRLQLAALVAAFLGVPPGVRAQADAEPPRLSEAEAEAYQMSRELSFVCNPQRHRTLQGTQSLVRRGSDALTGTAALLRSAEGTFLILEGYDAQLFGHCLVLGWFGGELSPGTYAIRRLSMAAVEEDVTAERRSFFAMPAVRTDRENSILVAEAGTLELTSTEGGRLMGSFDFLGVSVEQDRRADGVSWEGTFSAVEVER